TPGFWNNVGVCCGSAGVADFFLARHRRTKDPPHLPVARRLAPHFLARATRAAAGGRWVAPGHRREPDGVAAATGYMQGAAGIATVLLHFDEFDHGKMPAITFPDSP